MNETRKEQKVRIMCPLCEARLIKTNFKKHQNYFICIFCKIDFTIKDLKEIYNIDLELYNTNIQKSKNEMYWILKSIILIGLFSIVIVLIFSIFK